MKEHKMAADKEMNEQKQAAAAEAKRIKDEAD